MLMCKLPLDQEARVEMDSGRMEPSSSGHSSISSGKRGVQVEVGGDVKGEGRESSDYCAAVIQRFYRGYRTRRLLADSAVVIEELWWQAINDAGYSTISFSNSSKPETIASRWIRTALNASKGGKGLSKDARGQKLAFQHWIEAIDPRNPYGHSLHLYYEEWYKAEADQPPLDVGDGKEVDLLECPRSKLRQQCIQFLTLDVGDGKEVDLLECPRSKLRQQCIKYFGPQEKEQYEYDVVEGKIVQKNTAKFLDSNTD